MFISSAEYLDAIRQVLDQPGAARVAVAFWGAGADDLLARRRGRTRVLCNLSSGATNPEVVERLLGVARVELRHHDRLHAKLIVCGGAALVGSANLSANGLGFEGAEVKAWEEAGLMVRDAEVVRRTRSWFDRMWRAGRPVSPADLEAARAIWLRRRRNRGLAAGTAPSAAFDLREIPAEALADSGVLVALYTDGLSDEAQRAYQAAVTVRGGRLASPGGTGSALAYEDWPALPRRAPIVDVWCPARRAPRCMGVFKVWRQVPFVRDDGSRGTLQLCEQESTLLWRAFGPAQARRFAAQLAPHLNRLWDEAPGDAGARLVPLEKVAAMVCTSRPTPGRRAEAPAATTRRT